MRAREYLRHFSRLRGVDVPTAERRLHELAEELSIAPWLDVPLQAMSRGTAQKVALAQAFLAPLDLVVLDEPQAALDDAAVGALCALVDRARRQGAAIVVADHGPPLGVDAITYVLDEATLKRSSLE
jgi:ABC-type multidrug transport system ATPase subunit